MIKLENFEVVGWEHAIRGMRNPMNSWDRSDSVKCGDISNCSECPAIDDRGKCGYKGYEFTLPKDLLIIGPNDKNLMMNLAKNGPVHAKYRRMIGVYVDITAPLYWWKEFDTYKVGTVANSCSTMHTIHKREFELSDFSCEHLFVTDSEASPSNESLYCVPMTLLGAIIDTLNYYRQMFLETKDKKYWWQMIQLLPSSYNQKRTVYLTYEVLANIYKWRENHKVDDWVTFCKWIDSLPYSEIITLKEKEKQT